MKTKRDLPSDFDGIVPAGTDIVLVELLDKTKGIWIGEAHLPDLNLVGGFRHTTLTVKKDDLTE